MKRKIYGRITTNYSNDIWFALTSAPVGYGNTLDVSGVPLNWDANHDTWVVVNADFHVAQKVENTRRINVYEPHLVYLPKGGYVFSTHIAGREIETNEPEEEEIEQEEYNVEHGNSEHEYDENELESLINSEEYGENK